MCRFVTELTDGNDGNGHQGTFIGESKGQLQERFKEPQEVSGTFKGISQGISGDGRGISGGLRGPFKTLQRISGRARGVLL